MTVALITGASRGLGRSLAEALAARGWSLVLDGRDADALETAVSELRRSFPPVTVRAVAGDVRSPEHRRALLAEVAGLGGIDLLVNNASTLGAPLATLEHASLEVVREVYDVNVLAPLALMQDLLPALRGASRPVVVNVTSDAAVEHYETWGAYGSSKAALEHLTATLAVEEPTLRFLSVDPGDMNTRMHQEAFPGEDISDRPDPSTVAPAIVALVEGDSPSGRYRASEVAATIVETPERTGAALANGGGRR